MSQNIQNLIDKIKTEGFQAAEDKGKEIEQQARQRSDKILQEAQQKADHMIQEAKNEIQRMEESTRMALKQSSRDTVLSLKKEIDGMLQKIVKAQVQEALSSENLANIIGDLVKELAKDNPTQDIQVILNPADLKTLQEDVLAKLQKQMKAEIQFKAAEDIGKGFTISFDEGRSCFDFTDESLTKYLSLYLNAQVLDLMKESLNS